MRLVANDRAYEFVEICLKFDADLYGCVFARKNNKTLAETLRHPRYAHLATSVLERYGNALQEQLGDFLYRLQRSGDPFYKSFLNSYGDEIYCRFRTVGSEAGQIKGLYCFTVGHIVMYIGKTTDSLGKRIDHGYGRIHPKNCYLDGQSTNCHLNALIARRMEFVQLFACSMQDDAEIGEAEKALLIRYSPEWNIHLSQ